MECTGAMWGLAADLGILGMGISYFCGNDSAAAKGCAMVAGAKALTATASFAIKKAYEHKTGKEAIRSLN